MTYYKSNFYPIDGTPDDPVPVWEEFSRIQSHFHSLDQNNIAKNGISTGRIVDADDPDHRGISDMRVDDTPAMQGLPYFDGFPYVSFKGGGPSPARTLWQAHPGDSGVWYRLDGSHAEPYGPAHIGKDTIKLDLFSRWEAPWIFGASAEFCLIGTNASLYPPLGGRVEMRIDASTAKPSPDKAVGYLSYDNSIYHRSAICTMTTMIVPPGKFEVFLSARGLWQTHHTGTPEIEGTGGMDLTFDAKPGEEQMVCDKANLFAFGLYR